MGNKSDRNTQGLKSFLFGKSMSDIFHHKGEIAPIAEKASKNIKSKMKNSVAIHQRLYHFAIGHSFKQIDKENVFQMCLDEEMRKKFPLRFKSLQSFSDGFCKEFQDGDSKGIIPALRNINSHYIHDFQQIHTGKLSPQLCQFLKESFELAVIHTYIDTKNIEFVTFDGYSDKNERLVEFLAGMFFPKPKKVGVEDRNASNRQYFQSLSLEDAIDTLLFVRTSKNKDWEIEHLPAFSITSGTYLSFHACLFLLTMFLYKNEASMLISKINGFKRSDGPEEQSKRDVFTFFSKKFTSEDINSEHAGLIKFRDIARYLHHYPLAWNELIESGASAPAMANDLKSAVIDMEIARAYPVYEPADGDTKEQRLRKEKMKPLFAVYAKCQLWGKKLLGKTIETEYIKLDLSDKLREEFSAVLHDSDAYKGYLEMLKLLEAKICFTERENAKKDKDILETKADIEKHKEDKNETTEKLNKQIKHNLLLMSYGRNQDRFMQFATRFLAEKKYFGSDALFKTYQFRDMSEQEEYLAPLREALPEGKKEYDSKKYHRGKLVHFSTFADHLARYESWDMPFVIEDNAVKVKLCLKDADGSATYKTITIQRKLMVYMLENALYSPGEICGKGRGMLQAYYLHHHAEIAQKLEILSQGSEAVLADKADMKKLLPKRLVRKYAGLQTPAPAVSPALKEHLIQANKAEKRYAALLAKAKAEKNEEDFLKRNKGLQFKLQFVRKAWNLMYLRGSYFKQQAVLGHHKSLHITRDEINDFSRYMFAFDQTPEYKLYLEEMLANKGFLSNPQFAELFRSGKSLTDYYTKTKQAYTQWLADGAAARKDSSSFSLSNYDTMLNVTTLNINLSHFLAYATEHNYLQKNEQGRLSYRAIDNAKHLIEEYYGNKPNCKSQKKLYNNLQAAKLEDALLYEIAMRYLADQTGIRDEAKAHISKILTQDIHFNIKGTAPNVFYKLSVPLKKLESFIGHQQMMDEQLGRKGNSSYLTNIATYLEKPNLPSEINTIAEKIQAKNPIRYDELHKIDGHIVTQSIRFARLAMALEKYYVCKPDANGSISIKDKGTVYDNTGSFAVKYKKTGIPEKYFQVTKKEDLRNKSFHLGIPLAKTFKEQILYIEAEFVRDEINNQRPADFASLSKTTKEVCWALIRSVHDEWLKSADSDKNSKAEQKFWNEIIMKK
jgi:hypothetical protein